ncbi:MAG: hypothetical protein ACJAZK_002120 [Psychroserpens sp.]|uniref:DMP19 family protein n=1 Tax=Psychroserpens sp. TaxID=2020870 RepID=UPI0039E62656
MTEIDFALHQNQGTEVIELVGTVLWNKASEMNDFSELSQPEQTFIYIDVFESELVNGGVFDFFYNTSGAYAHEVLEAYEAIGAKESVELVNQAIKSFPELPVPKDIIFRRSFMSGLDKDIQDKWNTIEDEFLNSKEDIVALLIGYIKTHKSTFEY